MPAGASNSLWASHCSRFTDEDCPVKRICVWRLDGGRWFIHPILRQSDCLKSDSASSTSTNYASSNKIAAVANTLESLLALILLFLQRLSLYNQSHRITHQCIGNAVVHSIVAAHQFTRCRYAQGKAPMAKWVSVGLV